MSKRIQGWAPELHGGQVRPKRKSELTEEDKKQIKKARAVEKALMTLQAHGVIEWDKSNPREWNAGLLLKCQWSAEGDDFRFGSLPLDMSKVVIMPIGDQSKEVVN
jgi:hypothetical protein